MSNCSLFLKQSVQMSTLSKLIKYRGDLAKDNIEKYYYITAGGMSLNKTKLLTELEVFLQTGDVTSMPLMKWAEIIGTQNKSVCINIEPMFSALNKLMLKTKIYVPEELCMDYRGNDVYTIVKGFIYLMVYFCCGAPYIFQYTDEPEQFIDKFNMRADAILSKMLQQVNGEIENLSDLELEAAFSEILNDDLIKEVRDDFMNQVDGEGAVVSANLDQTNIINGEGLEDVYNGVMNDVSELVMKNNYYTLMMKRLPSFTYKYDTVNNVTQFLPWFLTDTTQVDITDDRILCSSEMIDDELIRIHDSFNVKTLSSCKERPFTVNGIVTHVMDGLIKSVLEEYFSDDFAGGFSHQIQEPSDVSTELYVIISNSIFSMYARSIPHLKKLIEETYNVQKLCTKHYGKEYVLQSQLIGSYLIASIPGRFETYLKLSRYPSSIDVNDFNIWLYNGKDDNIINNMVSIYKTLVYLKDKTFFTMLNKSISYANDILSRYPYFVKHFSINFDPNVDTMFNVPDFNEIFDTQNRIYAGVRKIELAYGTNSSVKILKVKSQLIMNKTLYDTICDDTGTTTEASKKETLLIAMQRAIASKEKICLLNYKVDNDKIIYNDLVPEFNIDDLISLMTPKITPHDEDLPTTYCVTFDVNGLMTTDIMTEKGYVVKDNIYDFVSNINGEKIPINCYYTNGADIKTIGYTIAPIPSWNKKTINTEQGPFTILCRLPFKSSIAVNQSY